MVTRILTIFFCLWAYLVPITSVLIVPSVQGTVPGYLMCYLSFGLVVLFADEDKRGSYMAILGVCSLVWIFFFSVSQLADMTIDHPISLNNVVAVNPQDKTFVMRTSLFTQSLYLAAVILFGTFVCIFYERRWDKALIAGGVLMALFGIYECAYFSFTGMRGDFITNRGFGSDLGQADGSWMNFQTLVVAGHTVMRLKSLTGEPSMYVFSMFPYWIYARTVCRSPWPARILGLSLLLTFSTTAVVGFLCFLGVKMLRMRIDPVRVVVSALIFAVVCYLFRDYILEFLNDGVFEKVQGRNDSGAERYGNFMWSVEFWASLPLINQLVGVGFGYIRSTDMASTLLVNNGIVGLFLFSFVFLYPSIKLDNSDRSLALRLCLVSIYAMMMTSVPEFSYLAPWAFLGMAYHRLRENRRDAAYFNSDPGNDTRVRNLARR